MHPCIRAQLPWEPWCIALAACCSASVDILQYLWDCGELQKIESHLMDKVIRKAGVEPTTNFESNAEIRMVQWLRAHDVPWPESFGWMEIENMDPYPWTGTIFATGYIRICSKRRLFIGAVIAVYLGHVRNCARMHGCKSDSLCQSAWLA